MGIPILKADNALQSSDVSMYPYHPCSNNVCENEGHCNPLLDRYECICRNGFAGQHCQDRKCLISSLFFLFKIILPSTASSPTPSHSFKARFAYVFSIHHHTTYLKEIAHGSFSQSCAPYVDLAKSTPPNFHK